MLYILVNISEQFAMGSLQANRRFTAGTEQCGNQ
jgi:hypothetical protein